MKSLVIDKREIMLDKDITKRSTIIKVNNKLSRRVSRMTLIEHKYKMEHKM